MRKSMAALKPPMTSWTVSLLVQCPGAEGVWRSQKWEMGVLSLLG